MVQAPRVILVPLDERPVNTGLVQEVAQVAGFQCLLPPADVLPDFREPADTGALARWLLDETANADALVVSIDTLVYGGLIPARTTHDPVEDSASRLTTLRRIHQARPELPIYAVSLVTRASNSYSNVEEPGYWERYGRDLHHLGAASHRAWQNGEGVSPHAVQRSTDPIPADVRADFAKRRLRNHVVNLVALQMQWDGVLDYLAITADDTAEYSAGSAEQQWLGYWDILGGPGLDVVGYPGADETGAVLMARALTAGAGFSPKVRVLAGDPSSLDLVPPYENGPIRDSIRRQVAAGGGQLTQDEGADLVLVVHGPDPDRGDHGAMEPPHTDPGQVSATVATVRSALELANGAPVVLADVRFANGGDAPLIDALAREGLLAQLAAYGGWNTAGNALGGTVATGLAIATGRKTGALDPDAQHRAFVRRLLDDVAYQSRIRRDLMHGVFQGSLGPVGSEALEVAAAETVERMNQQLADWGLAETTVKAVRFPWNRSFEVDIDLG